MLGVASALRYMHSRYPAVVHGDLKDSNVFVQTGAGHCRGSCPPIAKLLDFGLSRVLTKHAKPLGGTPRWAAPEIFSGLPPSTAADVFSFGLLVYFITTGIHPNLSSNAGAIEKRERIEKLKWPESGGWLTEQSRSVVRECCVDRSEDRASIADVHKRMSREMEPLIEREELLDGSKQVCSTVTVWTAPNYAPTSERIVKAMLIEVFTSCNTDNPVACCRFHSALLGVQRILADMKHDKCQDLVPPERFVAQCGTCGVLLQGEHLQDGPQCFFCDVSVGGVSHLVKSSYSKSCRTVSYDSISRGTLEI
jgi:serine/threonine protein kinase